MANKAEDSDVELIYAIVNAGMASKLIRAAKRYGVPGGTVALGKGTVDSRVLNFLGLSDVKKEIVLMLADRKTAYEALEKMNKEFAFNKPNHGVVFTTTVCAVLGTRKISCEDIKSKRGADNIMYHAITIIVDRGKAEEVIDAASGAGSKGGTIINGRGSGIHETKKLFLMDIEPEKEIVIILSEEDSTEAIVSSIRTNLKIDQPGNGIIFVQDVNKTYGIYR